MKMSSIKSPAESYHRILHITFNMGFGGTEQVIRQLVKHLPLDRYSNEILCVDGAVGDIGQALKKQGITVHVLKRFPGFDWRLALDINKLIRNRGFTIVHCHQYTPWLYGWLASFGTGAKLVFTEHGRFHPDSYRRKAWLVNRFLGATTSAIVAISKATGDALVKYEYLPRRRIEIIYNGIESVSVENTARLKVLDEFDLSADTRIIGTVARLDPVKNQDLILDAVSWLAQRVDKLHVVIVGDGPEREILEKRAKELGIENKVSFTGFISEPAHYLASMDIFLLPSFTEGASMTLLEAMSLGVPAVASRVGGSPEIIENSETGLLFDVDQPDRFIEHVSFLLEHPEKRKAIAENAKTRFAEKFSIYSFVSNYMALYES